MPRSTVWVSRRAGSCHAAAVGKAQVEMPATTALDRGNHAGEAQGFTDVLGDGHHSAAPINARASSSSRRSLRMSVTVAKCLRQ